MRTDVLPGRCVSGHPKHSNAGAAGKGKATVGPDHRFVILTRLRGQRRDNFIAGAPFSARELQMMAYRILAVILVAALAGSQAMAAPEQIDIPDGSLTLHATLYRPEGPGPFPAVVALHDCGGLTRRPNTEAQLYSEWAKNLVDHGFVV